MAVNHGANGIAEVAQEVPAIGHLDRVRRTLTDPVCIGARTVAGDDLNSGMLTQPRSECLGLSVRQEIHDPVEGQVNRLKMLKRTMYGQAGFQLLRARVLHAA